jgi:hypothetical protein
MIVDAHALYRQAYQSFQVATADLNMPEEEYLRRRGDIVATRGEQLLKEIPSLLDAASNKGWIEDVLLRCDPVEPCSPYHYNPEAELELRRILVDRLVAEHIEKALADDKSVKVRRRYWSYDDCRSFSGFDLLVSANISTEERAAIRVSLDKNAR